MLATVIEVQGASPAKVGDQLVLCSDGSTAGTVGGGKLEDSILTDAKRAIETGEVHIRHYKLAELDRMLSALFAAVKYGYFSTLTYPNPG